MKHVLSVMLLGLCGISTASFATEPADAIATIEISLNSVWVVLAAMLVFLMQAGFALVESGMVRSKNAVNVVMKNYMDACVGGLIFWLIGYGLMFGANPTGWFGQSHFAPSDLAHWDWTFMFFQMMFAATATTIASGAMAERVHFGAYLIGACLISGLIYPIFGSWAWGSAHGGTGWLKALGFIDFAGSTVVHSIGGWVALAGIMVLGARLGRFAPDGSLCRCSQHHVDCYLASQADFADRYGQWQSRWLGGHHRRLCHHESNLCHRDRCNRWCSRDLWPDATREIPLR